MRGSPVVVGALLIQLWLGVIYAWSAFPRPLTTPLATSGAFGFSIPATQSRAVLLVGLAPLAVVLALAGRWQAGVGPRLVALLGGLQVGRDCIAASVVGRTRDGQLRTIGMIAGAGLGVAHVGPLAASVFKDVGLDKGVSVWMPAIVAAGAAPLLVAVPLTRLQPVKQAGGTDENPDG
jgi:OFA family oxalate/formate antiporter-like MFS transporter